jgi:putative peptide zinc metalloprotease protein
MNPTKTIHSAAPTAPGSQSGGTQPIDFLLEHPWMGLRPDLVLYPGPLDFDGQRSWVLEDPVRGNNFRLGHAEGELLYRLTTEPDLESAVRKLYNTTTLRPSIQEIVGFITMLQREHLAVLPADRVIEQEAGSQAPTNSSLLHQVLQGQIFFRIPLLRPDAFLRRTLPMVSILWTAPLKWVYLICGIVGLGLTLQEIEQYLSTASYLFTPQGSLAFIFCLVLLKTGHEFAHAYTAKSYGLHVRSMGLFFIVIWPLLYTDTTDAWKIPDRRRRIRVSAAGVLFELAVGGIALSAWAFLPDGILRSLMFFLSGTSLVSTLFINLNPFMRYDGYYVLMDYWGVDNLRPRAFAMFRHALRRLLLDWQGPVPEIHPNRRGLIIYGFLAGMYRIFVGFSIAIAVYYLFFPALGLVILLVEVWLFLIRPLWVEVQAVARNRRFLGSKLRLAVSAAVFFGLFSLLIIPIPYTAHVPALLLYQNATRIEAASAGRLAMKLPEEGQGIQAGELLARISSEQLIYELQQTQFDLAGVRVSIRSLGGGGEQGAYRQWLMAEEERMLAAIDKYRQAIAQLEIHSPITGRVVEVNKDLYPEASVAKGTYLFTVADPDAHELKAFVHEKRRSRLEAEADRPATVHFAGPEAPVLEARILEKGVFPIQTLPNESLLDVAGGPIASIQDSFGRRARDAYFAFTFAIDEVPAWMSHGMPGWIWLKSEGRSILKQGWEWVWQNLFERGLL